MLSLLLLLLPTAVSIIFTFKFLISKSTHRSRHILPLLSFASALYFFADANYYSAYEDYPTLIISDIISAYAAPALPALVMIFLRSIVFERYMRWYSYLVLIAIPCTLGAMTLTQYLYMGMDTSIQYIQALDTFHPTHIHILTNMGRTASLHFHISILLYYTITAILSLLTLWQVAYYMHFTKFRLSEIRNFLFHRGELEPFHLEGILFTVLFFTFVLRLFIYRSYILQHQGIAILFSLIFSLLTWAIFHIACDVHKPTLTLLRPRVRVPSPTVFSGSPAEVSSPTPVPTASAVGPKLSYLSLIEEEDCLSLLESIRTHMHTDRPYLSPTLTIEDLAHSLCTNKSYISRCINQHLHLTFRDYLATLRIDHAKQLMLSEPSLLQEEIATRSGFLEASQFNRKFKQLTGTTPRQWLLSQQP